MPLDPENITMHPFAAAILHNLKDKFVEINCGDVRTVLTFSDFEVNQKNLIRGYVRDAMGDCLMVEVKRNSVPPQAAIVYVNVWAIKCLMEISAGNMHMRDIYEDEEFRSDRGRR